MDPRRAIGLSIKVVLTIGIFTFAVTTAQSTQSKRNLDLRLPEHLPIKVKLKKEKEESFQNLSNERWMRDFELEVKNTGNRPIYALSLVWQLTDVRAPDGNPYGGTLLYGRHEFITVPGERPKPEDDPIEPGETHVFTLGESTAGGWESFAKTYEVNATGVMVFLNLICFGDSTGMQGPNGQPFNLEKKNGDDSPNVVANSLDAFPHFVAHSIAPHASKQVIELGIFSREFFDAIDKISAALRK